MKKRIILDYLYIYIYISFVCTDRLEYSIKIIEEINKLMEIR